MARILVIDDDDFVREMLTHVLKKAGHTVVAAPDGEVGTRMFREEPADLIVTDIVMPEKDGWESIMEFRKEAPKVKIIAISGGAKVGPFSYLMTAKRLGADRILRKPVKKEELLENVNELLESTE